jgi:hypothetical protein
MKLLKHARSPITVEMILIVMVMMMVMMMSLMLVLRLEYHIFLTQLN